MVNVSFEISDADCALIRKVVSDAKRRGLLAGYSKLDIEMDLTATHANGCPIDFQKLLDASDFDFGHDIAGIRRHLNRRTGKLERHFRPRCAVPATEVADG